jgi:hypothetical protein
VFLFLVRHIFPRLSKLKCLKLYLHSPISPYSVLLNINKHVTLKPGVGYLRGIALGYGLDDLGFESRQEWGFIPSPPRLDRLWDPPSLLSNGYQGLLLWGYSGWGVKLTTHLHLIPRSECVEAYIHAPSTPSRRGFSVKNAETTLHYFALLCFALLCFALHCFALLYFTLLYFTLLYSAFLCFSLLYFTLLSFSFLYFTLLYFTLLFILTFEFEIESKSRRV